MRTGDVPSLADLDRLYFQGSPVELAKAVAALPRAYALSMSELYEQVISDVRDGKAGTIHPELYRAYSENLRKAVSGYADDDLKTQFEANLSRFAAYKAWHATRQLERQLADRDGVIRSPEAFDRMARAVLNTFNQYQAAEYNTAVARARTAHQWQQFSQGDNMFLFPNLRWLPSRSANPREQHMPFYNRVWAKTDPFWNSNQPGNLWNCKCDWEETDDPVTGDNPEGLKPAKGLEGNPAETGEIFTDQCTYVQKAGKTGGGEVEEFFRPIAEHHQQYLTLRNDPDYEEVKFDWGNGGLRGDHVDHNFDKKGGVYEKHVQTAGYKAGHAVILESEPGTSYKLRYTEGLWDGRKFEVAGRETATENNVLKGIKHCARKGTTKIAILDFPKGGFNEEILQNAITRYRGLEKLNDGQFIRFEKIICVQDETIIYEATL